VAALILGAATMSVGAVVAAGPACAAGEMRVSVVVDFGDLPDKRPTSAVCVPGSDGDNAAEILDARAKQLGTPKPRYDSSGLLCAIDGLPATGCGERTSDGYKYWSYFHGTASGWEYSNVGPTGSRAHATESEGWRFTDGTGLPSDPPPNGPADPAATCVPPPSQSSQSTSASTSGGQGGGPSATAGAAKRPAAGAAAPTVVGAPVATTTIVPTGEATSTTVASTDDAEEAAATRAGESADDDGGGRAAGTLVGLAAVIGLVGAGTVAARRRRPG
jgi:hypothetical protein